MLYSNKVKSMPDKAFFLDRDGCLIKEKDYLSNVKDLEIYDFSFEAVKIMKEKGYLVFVLTNQSGVARGYFTEADVKIINDEIQKRFRAYGTSIDGFYYCPHYKDGKIKEYAVDCECRKPKIGLVKQALNDYPQIDLSQSYMVGDKFSDIQMAHNAGCKGILVRTGYGKEELKNPHDNITPEKVCENLFDAVKRLN